MKKLFLIFTVLFTCSLPVSGFGDVVTNNRKELDQFTNRLQNQFTGFTSNLKQYSTDFQTRNQQEYADFQARSQQEISNFRKRSDDKIAEIKRKSAEAFEKLEQAYNDFIKGTPFENCIPGWSYLECKQVNNLSKSTWSCKLKSGITAQKMSSDVEAYCATKTNAFEYDPLDDFEEPENEEDSGRVRMTAQVEEIPEELKTNTTQQSGQGAPYATQQNNSWNTNYEDSDEIQETENTIKPDKSVVSQLGTKKTAPKQTDSKTRTALLSKAYSKYCDDEGYTPSHPTTDLGERYATKPTIDCSGEKGKVTLNCYKIKDIRQSLNQEDLKHFCSPDTITNFTIKTVTRPNTHIRKCKANEKKSINATDCKISADGKYSDIECDHQKGYWLNATSTACEKSGRQETNKKCTPDQLNQLNAKSGKLYYYAETPNTQYCGITKCNDNYVIDNSQQQEKCVCPTTNNEFELKDGKCIKKSDTPEKTKKSAKPELINITATVVIKGTDTPIGGVDIKYDEGKKDKEGNIKYGKHRTGNSGLFAIDIVPGSTVTFTHKMYKDTNETFSATIKQSDNKKINMTPTEATTENTQLQTLCEKDKKGTWNKTSGKCNCKGNNTTFDKTKGCIEPENLQRGGNVIDEKGNPMPNVTIKYGNKKIQTDKDGRFDITAPKGTTITFTAKGYKDIKETLDEARPNWDIDMEPTDKAANNAEKQKLCEKDGKGEWKPKLNKCNCKDKKAFFDETDGCTTATTEYTNAESALETLYEQFKTQLETIQAQNNE